MMYEEVTQPLKDSKGGLNQFSSFQIMPVICFLADFNDRLKIHIRRKCVMKKDQICLVNNGN